jgi:peroxiredoxin
MSELRGLQLRIDDFRAAGSEVIAVSVDPVERNREVAGRLGLEFPLLSDPDLVAIDAFGLRDPGGSPFSDGDVSRPALFVLRDGVVRWRSLTDNWRVRPRAEDLLVAVRQVAAESE